MKQIIRDILAKAEELGFSFNESDAHDMYLVFKKYEDEKEDVIEGILKALNPRNIDFKSNVIGSITLYRSNSNEIDKAIIRAVKLVGHKPK